MNQKNSTKADTENIESIGNNLKLPFTKRTRHHSDTNDLKFNTTMYDELMNFSNNNNTSNHNNNNLDIDINSDSGFIENNSRLTKLGSSAPNNNSWYFNDHRCDNDQTNDKSPIINSDYSASELSDDDQDDDDDDEKSSLASFKKSNSFKLKFGRSKNKQQTTVQDTSTSNNKKLSNFLQLPKPSSLFSSSTGSINLATSPNQTTSKKSAKKSAKNMVRKRKRCYSMDDRRKNIENDFNSPFSFDNLAYNKENLSDISEPLSGTERSNEELNKKKTNSNFNYQLRKENYLLSSEQQQQNSLRPQIPPPIILINNSRLDSCKVKFDINSGDDIDDDEDKNEDKDYLIKNDDDDDDGRNKSSQIDIELGSNESSEDLSDKATTNEIEFTTKLASDLAKSEIETESLLAFVFQVLFPLFVCGLGNLCAGILLSKIENYEVIKEINELYIAVPCLMGLKGNLEMTMASRLSTAANLGILEHLPQILSITKSNICLLQLQATVVSLLASLYGVYSHIMDHESPDIHNILLLITTNVLTANICCTLLSALMIAIILFCKHQSINPDNVATPIASSLGDVSTVFLLGYISSYLFESIELKNYWLSPLILIIILIITPFSLVVAFKNENTKTVLKNGWLPIILSMLISNLAGIILDKMIKLFKAFALFQPTINGVGGNLAAIQASRISTYLHKTTKFGHLPVKELSTIDSRVMLEMNDNKFIENKNLESNLTESTLVELNDLKDVDLNEDHPNENLTNTFEQSNKLNHVNNDLQISISPTIVGSSQKKDCFNYTSYKTRKILRVRRKKIKNYLQRIFSSGSIHTKCARLLILITLPMHILYFYLIKLIDGGRTFNSFSFFVVFYLMVAFGQMTTLLYLAKLVVYWLWKHKFEPDNWAIPLLTSAGDLAGTSFLAIVFFTFSNSTD